MQPILTATVIGVSVGAVIVVTLYKYCSYRKKYTNLPDAKKWHKIGTLKKITMYPIKSSAGLDLGTAHCGVFGLKCQTFWDRCLVLLDDDGNVGFAGAHPKMLSVETQIVAKDSLCVKAPNLTPLMININQIVNSDNATVIKKCMSNFCLQLIKCSAEHHKWFSMAVLGRDSGFEVYISLDPTFDKSIWRKSKAEFMPYMVLHDQSINNLNSRLPIKNHVHHRQFRGNFLIESTGSISAFDEDTWEWLRIGDDLKTATILRYNSPCLRCILPNINVFTYERNADYEPLRTLKTFRLRSHKNDPEMGIYFDLHKEGVIKQGENVYVQYR